MLSAMLAAVFFLLCIFCALKDISSLTISNWMNAAIALLFIPAALVLPLGWAGFGWHLVAALIAFGVTFGLFVFNVLGGGDAKMIPAVTLWMGPPAALEFVAYTALAGGVLAFTILIARKYVPAAFAPGFIGATLEEGEGVPYGVAIAAGAIFAAPHTPLLTDFLNQFSVFN